MPVHAPSGTYIARFANDARSGSFHPFVVRSTHPSRRLFVFRALNLEAYNRWGGSSLDNTTFGSPASLIGEARAYSVRRGAVSRVSARWRPSGKARDLVDPGSLSGTALLPGMGEP